VTAVCAAANVTGPADLVRLRVQLRDVKPTPWRRVVVPAAVRLDHLHRVIQAAMGWEDAHLWSFHLHGVDYGPETGQDPHVPFARFRLRAGERFIYIYDFGDWWEHEVRVEAATLADMRECIPWCVGGNGTCPPEDCGGPAGYADAVGEALGLDAELDMAELAEFGRDLLAARDTGDFGPIMDVPDRLDDLDRIVRRSQGRLRLAEPFDRRAANERLSELAGADEELSP
jgi:hypothetical protein